MMSTDEQKYINLNEIPPNINGLIKHYEQSTPHHKKVKQSHYRPGQALRVPGG